MGQIFECDWCAEGFRSESGMQWHVENAHLRVAGLLIPLNPKWAGVRLSIGELPGEHLVVLRGTTPLDASDEAAIAAVKIDFARFAPIIRAIERTVDNGPPTG